MNPEAAGRLLKASTRRRWPRHMWPSLAASKLRHQQLADHRCPQCGNAGWVIDAKIDKDPTTLELIPCIYPPCEHSGRDVSVLCLYGEWGTPVLHPTTGGVMSLSRMPPDARHFRRQGAPA